MAGFTDPWDMFVISADRPDDADADADADGLLTLEPGAARAGDVHWYFSGVFRGPTAKPGSTADLDWQPWLLSLWLRKTGGQP